MSFACRRAALLVLGLTLSAEVAARERICGSEYLRLHAEEFRLPRFKVHHSKQQEDEIKVGSRLEFHVRGRFTLLSATCRFAGQHGYVFVEDAQWDENGGPILQLDVDFLGGLFEEASPADPARGVFELETAVFGDPPDVDDDPRIYILVLDLDRPGLLGYFDPGIATDPDPALRRDMIFMSSDALLENQYAAGGTLAHEFQHLIHWGHDPDEEIWLNEGLSGYAELLSGYPEIDATNVPEFLRRPGIGVTGWEDRSYNYGATYLYVAFLAERFGIGLMGELVREPRNGIDGVDAGLALFQQDFRATWADWSAANYAATDVRYGYETIGDRRVPPLVTPGLPFDRVDGEVEQQWGTTYVIFRDRGSTEIEFFGDPNGRYGVQLYVMRNGSGDLRNMGLDGDSRGVARVENADSLVVIVGRSSVQGRDFEISARKFDPVTAVVATAGAGEAASGLDQPFPNPFNSQVALPFRLGEGENAEAVLRLYGALGNPVRTFRLGQLPNGTHRLTWDGTDDRGRQVASGRYLAQLQAGSISSVRSLTLAR